jgi:uncharacterized SAM-binding protein YcdF (DUF218 family)
MNKLPIFLPWLQAAWINKRLIVTLVLLVVSVILFWGIKRARWRHWFKNRKGFWLLFGLTGILPLLVFFASEFLVVFLPSDPGTKADAIVLLGRGAGGFYTDRADLAAKLWKAGRAPLVFASGINDAGSLLDQVEEKGIPQRALDGENCSLTTAENALFSAAILQAQGRQRILLVTDEPHMLRSMLVFRANGFTVIPRTTPLPSYLSFRDKAFLTLREYGGLIGYALQGLYFPQKSLQSSNSDVLELVQKAREYGKQRSLK